MNNELEEVEKYLREKYYFVDYPRNKDVIHYHKIVKEETQSQAERTTKLRDIEIDMLLDDINESEYTNKKAEVFNIATRDKDYIGVIAPIIHTHRLDSHQFTVKLNMDMNIDYIPYLVRDFERQLYTQFQQMLQNIKVEPINNINELHGKLNYIKYSYLEVDMNIYHYMKRPDFNLTINENNLLDPNQVLLTPAVYFDIKGIYVRADMDYYSKTFIIEYYLDILEQDNSVILDLKF